MRSILDRWGLRALFDLIDPKVCQFVCDTMAGLLGDPEEIAGSAEEISKSANSEQAEIARQLTIIMPSVVKAIPRMVSALCPQDREQDFSVSRPHADK